MDRGKKNKKFQNLIGMLGRKEIGVNVGFVEEFQNLIGMLGSTPHLHPKFLFSGVSKPYRYARKKLCAVYRNPHVTGFKTL